MMRLALVLSVFLLGIGGYVLSVPVYSQGEEEVSPGKSDLNQTELRGEEEPYFSFLERIARNGHATGDRASAIYLLSPIRREEVLDIYADLLDSSEPRVYGAVIDALGERMPSSEARQLLLDQVDQGNRNRVERATAVLRRHLSARTTGGLVRVLEESEPDHPQLIQSALRELTGFAPGEFPREEEVDRDVETEWGRWWYEVEDLSPAEWWLRILRNTDTSPATLSSVLNKIQDHRVTDATSLLIQLLSHDSGIVRDHSIRTLFILTGRRFEFDAFASGEKRDASVTRWLNWWEEASDQDRVTWLVSALKEESEENRSRIKRELARLNTPSQLSRVARLVNAEDASLQSIAVDILGSATGLVKNDQTEGGDKIQQWRDWWERNGEKDPFQWYIVTLQNDTNPGNRVYAARRLGEAQQRDRALRALVSEGLTDDRQEVRRASRDALIRWTGRDFHFSPGDPPEQREQAIQRWTDWLENQ